MVRRWPSDLLKTYLSIIPRIIGGLSLLLWEMQQGPEIGRSNLHSGQFSILNTRYRHSNKSCRPAAASKDRRPSTTPPQQNHLKSSRKKWYGALIPFNAARLENDCLQSPTDEKGEPEIINGKTDSQRIASRVERPPIKTGS